MTIIDGLSRAIARMEGFSSGASRIAVENNNPGNIRFWSNQTPQRGGFAVFSSLADGVRALNKVVSDYINGRYTGSSPTLEEMISKYAPAADKNDPQQYARLVSQWTGIPLGVPLKDVQWNQSNIELVNKNTTPIIKSSSGNTGGTTNFPTTGRGRTSPTTTSQVPKKRR